MPARVLVVEDDVALCDPLVRGLPTKGYDVVGRTTAAEALEVVDAEELDVVVTDLKMKGTNGLELCERIAANRPDLPVIVITAFGSLDTAVAAIRAGAYDFVTKPFDLEQIALALDRAVRYRRLSDEVKRLRTAARGLREEGPLIGASPAMEALRSLIHRVAQTDATVLVAGETGTGKELIAREVHQQSRRRGGPLVAVNAAAVPEQLLESELFGH